MLEIPAIVLSHRHLFPLRQPAGAGKPTHLPLNGKKIEARVESLQGKFVLYYEQEGTCPPGRQNGSRPGEMANGRKFHNWLPKNGEAEEAAPMEPDKKRKTTGFLPEAAAAPVATPGNGTPPLPTNQNQNRTTETCL